MKYLFASGFGALLALPSPALAEIEPSQYYLCTSDAAFEFEDGSVKTSGLKHISLLRPIIDSDVVYNSKEAAAKRATSYGENPSHVFGELGVFDEPVELNGTSIEELTNKINTYVRDRRPFNFVEDRKLDWEAPAAIALYTFSANGHLYNGHLYSVFPGHYVHVRANDLTYEFLQPPSAIGDFFHVGSCDAISIQ